MASKVELAEEIQEIDAEAEVDGLNHEELTAMLKELKGVQAELIDKIKKLDPEAETAECSNEWLSDLLAALTEKADAAGETDEEEPEPEPPPYQVAKGKAITGTRRYGIINEGAEVTADMVQGGKDTIDALVKRKLVIKN